MEALSDMRDKPAGIVSISAADHVSDTMFRPTLAALLPDYPDINAEIVIEYGIIDIVTGRWDAGLRRDQ